MENITPPNPNLEDKTHKSIFVIFGQAFSLYFKSAKFLAVMTVLAFLPVFIFRMFLPERYVEAFANFQTLWQYYLSGGNIHTSDIMSAISGDATMYAMIHLGIGIAFLPLMVGATIYLAACHLEEKPPNFSDMFNMVMPRFPAMLATTAIVTAIIMGLLFLTGGTFLMGIPIYIMVTLIFFMHVTADVGRWGLNAMSISRFLVRRRWFRVFFISLFILIAFAIASISLSTLGNFLGVSASPFTELPFFLLQQFMLSFFLVVFALWYFDTKKLHQRNLKAMEKAIFDQLRNHLDEIDFPNRPKDKPEDKNDE